MKKFISGLMSACVAVSSAIALTTSSAFNPNKDPNGDGNLTLADSTSILQYLGGHYEPSDLTELDMDDNDVVSVVDSNYVKMYDAGIINTSIEDTAEPMAENSTTSRSYVVYNAQTGAYLRSYDLSVRNADTSYNSRNIIGNNDRVTDWSNRGVAKILATDGTTDIIGSGFVVGPHTIATAAHVVFNTKNDYAYRINEILLFNIIGNEYSFTPVEYHFPYSQKTATGQSNGDDYALITVEEDLSSYMSFNLGTVTDNASSTQLQIATVGFPVYFDPDDKETLINNNEIHQEILSEGTLVTPVNSLILRHTADASGGNSGGPLYTIETLNGETYHTVIGIHISNGSNNKNVGLRLTSHVLKFLKANPNIQY